MAGPIIRQGIVQLGIEYKQTALPAAPIAAGIAAQQKASAVATTQAAEAAEAAAGSLEMQRRAEEAVEAAQERAIESSKIIAQQKRIEAKASANLASMVEMEAASVAKAGIVSATAAANAAKLSAANLKIAQSYQKAAVGVLTMVRGVALLAGSESESLAVAIKHIFFIQGLIDISKGAVNVQKALAAAYYAQAAAAKAAGVASTHAALATTAFNTAVRSGPLLILVGVLYIAAKAYEHFAGAAVRAAAMAEKQQETIDRLVEAEQARNEQVAIGRDADIERAAALNNLAEKEEAYRKILSQRAQLDRDTASGKKFADLFKSGPEVRAVGLQESLNGYEQQKAAAEALLAIKKEQAAERQREIGDQIELVKLRERELQAARNTLKTEQDANRSRRIAIGALNTGEQNKLKRLLEAALAGDLSKKQAVDLQKLGSRAGDVKLDKLGKDIADLERKVAARQTGKDPEAEAEAEVQRRLAARNKETGGKSADAAVKELQAQNDAVTNEATRFSESIATLITGLIDRIEGLEKETSKQQQGARAARAGRGK